MGDYRKIGVARLSLALSGVRMMQAALFAGVADSGEMNPFDHGSIVFWEAMGSDYDDLASADDLAALGAALEEGGEAVEHLVGSFPDGVVADDKTTWSVVLDELASDLTEAISA